MEETGARKAIASAGIDVGKAELHAHASGEDCSFANTSAGHNALRQWLAERGVQRVVMEPTGRYHRKAHQLLAAGGIEVVLINPRRSRRFGEAIGEMAKTDRIDAATLAKFGTLFPDLAPARPRDGFGEELEELLVARANLVDVRSKLGHVAGELGGPGEDAIMAVRKFAEKEIARLDTCIAAHIHSDPDYAERYAILLSIPGIGPVNAAQICCWMPELGSLGHRQAASLLGVAPFANDSGKHEGARHIHGRRRRPRDGLYMAAMCAVTHNPDMRSFAARLKAAGKKHKVVIVAVMRKLIILANALLRSGRRWLPEAPATVGSN